MGRFLLSIFLILVSTPVFAQSFDFSQKGDEEANAILKEYIKTNEIQGFYGDVVSYFYDTDGDSQNEIIGIVKSKLYYTLAGYNLVVLKKDENGWGAINTDIYFDDSLPFEISKNKISYHKSFFYKNRSKNYRAAVSIKDRYTDKKLKGIEEVVEITEGHASIEVNESDFPVCEQKSFIISYPDGYEKPKYHIELH